MTFSAMQTYAVKWGQFHTEAQRHRGRFIAGAPPQTPNAGQSLVIDWSSGHGVEPHLQITFASVVPFVAEYNSCFSVPLCETDPCFTAEVCTAEIVFCGSVTRHYALTSIRLAGSHFNVILYPHRNL